MSLTFSLSLPRARSVAILLSVTAAKSFDLCLHEPTIRPYDTIKYPNLTHDWFINQGFATFVEYENYLNRELSKGQRIFIKDMIFSTEDWLLRYLPLSPHKATILLWLRDPYTTLISLYQRYHGHNWDLILDQVANYKAMFELYLKFKSSGDDRTEVYIFDSDQLVRHPEAYLSKVTAKLGLSKFGLTQ
jgi:hypothetical protein